MTDKPTTMRERLIARAAPAAIINLDYGGNFKSIPLVTIANWPEVIDALLAELRLADADMLAAGMVNANTDLASEFTAMIDHILKP